ncbi:MAG: aldo/keto reductase [Treponema sp.]|nr:aldo/keto reductase [Treponema sp.]
MKLCLGTAQFGLDYGINNTRGKIPYQEVTEILNYAHEKGITELDTASAYGESEKVLGDAIYKTDKNFNIFTKYPANTEISPYQFIETSLDNLRLKAIKGYLFHNFSIYKNKPVLIDDFIKIKETEKSEKIGFSLYYPSEAEYILKNNLPCDILQIPYNIFDQRFNYLLPEIHNKGIEIYIRSIFLQGLFFKRPNTLEDKFTSISGKLCELQSIARKYSVDLAAFCMSYAYSNKFIKAIVIGIDSLANLKENINNYLIIQSLNIPSSVFEEFAVNDENIILPFNWDK